MRNRYAAIAELAREFAYRLRRQRIRLCRTVRDIEHPPPTPPAFSHTGWPSPGRVHPHLIDEIEIPPLVVTCLGCGHDLWLEDVLVDALICESCRAEVDRRLRTPPARDGEQRGA